MVPALAYCVTGSRFRVGSARFCGGRPRLFGWRLSPSMHDFHVMRAVDVSVCSPVFLLHEYHFPNGEWEASPRVWLERGVYGSEVPMTDVAAIRDALGALYGGDAGVSGDLTPLAGQASGRAYYRFRVDQPATKSVVVMVLPPDAHGSDEGGADGAPAELPFLDVHRYMAKREIPVPAVEHVDLERGMLVLEDLGDETFEQRLQSRPRAEREQLYQRAVDLLVHMQRACEPVKPAATVAFRRAFEPALLRWELDHFLQWGISALGDPLDDDELAVIEQAFAELMNALQAMPQVFVHRDFQSRNLMLDGADRLRLIDFQDALLGPQCYDLAALLCDSYVDLEEPLQVRLVQYYARQVGVEPEPLLRAFWAVAAHRKMKDAGRFVFIDRVRGNPMFLRHFPQSIQYVDRALGRLGLVALQQLLFRRIPGYPDSVQVPQSVAQASP